MPEYQENLCIGRIKKQNLITLLHFRHLRGVIIIDMGKMLIFGISRFMKYLGKMKSFLDFYF